MKRLCAGAETSAEPARCFKTAMHGSASPYTVVAAGLCASPRGGTDPAAGTQARRYDIKGGGCRRGGPAAGEPPRWTGAPQQSVEMCSIPSPA